MDESKKLITDIDVLAFRPTSDLRWELVLGDCKTLKGQSPANRSLWLRGLMDHFSASSGVIILQRKQTIENDHKLFAASLQIHLIDEEEFNRYDKAIIYPSGSSKYPISVDLINEFLVSCKKYEALNRFCEYINKLVWNEENRFDLLRKVIGETIFIAQEIDPEKKEHLALILDTSGIFAIGLAECVGKIFNQYLQPKTHSQLDEALKILIWGGKSQYHFIADLRRRLLEAKGHSEELDNPLSLPEWDRFIQLVRNMLENPSLSFSVPQMLRLAAFDIYSEKEFLPYVRKQDTLLVKYAMLTASYFCRAANLPPQVREYLEQKFVKRQSDLTHLSKNDE
jgi:hypothetical protein